MGDLFAVIIASFVIVFWVAAPFWSRILSDTLWARMTKGIKINKDVISMSMTDHRSCNKQPAGSPALVLTQAVNTMTEFQAALAALAEKTTESVTVLRNYRRANNGEVRNDL